MQLACSFVRFCITVYNTKYLQRCQDVEKNNLTEVAAIAKHGLCSPFPRQLFGNCQVLHAYLIEWR